MSMSNEDANQQQPAKRKASELTRLLAIATTAHGDFDTDYEYVIVTIGKGMFWSKEFDMEARALAKRIEEEFERLADMKH